MKKYIKEILLVVLISLSLIIHYFDLLDDSMMFSGLIVIIILGYITTLFQEKVRDERDEQIRYKTNRYLYVLMILFLLISIIYKIFSHIDYNTELTLLTTISIAKVILNTFIKRKQLNMKYLNGALITISTLAALYFIGMIYQEGISKIYKEKNTMQNNLTIKELDEKVQSGLLQKAVFSGGCFWCTEASFNPAFGVESAMSGFFGGNFPESPTYENHGNYREGVLVYFNNASTSYEKLLVNYWHHIDPTQEGGQFADIGESYKTAIYYFNDEQKKLAEESKKTLEKSKKFGENKIVVEIINAKDFNFFPAEEYHQDYAEKNPVRYEYYKNGSGRSKFIKDNWLGDKTFEEFLNGDAKPESDNAAPTFSESTTPSFSSAKASEKSTPSNEGEFPKSEIKKNNWEKFTKEMKEKRLQELTDIQKKVTQHEGTEGPFENEYDKNYEAGIYVDIVSGEPLYSSKDKYDSGTGWPSFVKPISEEFLTLKTDYFLFYPRTEVRSKVADSHLGHVFGDGPAELGGKRYCMNSAALRFIPLENMESGGYGEFVNLVK